VTVNENKKIVQRYWDALAARDWDTMKTLLTDDAHYTDVGVPGPGGVGPEGVIRRLRIGLEPLSGYSHLPGTNMIGQGDLVMLVMRLATVAVDRASAASDARRPG